MKLVSLLFIVTWIFWSINVILYLKTHGRFHLSWTLSFSCSLIFLYFSFLLHFCCIFREMAFYFVQNITKTFNVQWNMVNSTAAILIFFFRKVRFLLRTVISRVFRVFLMHWVPIIELWFHLFFFRRVELILNSLGNNRVTKFPRWARKNSDFWVGIGFILSSNLS